jgi:hypothetical protein
MKSSKNFQLIFFLGILIIFAFGIVASAKADSCDAKDGWYYVGSTYSCCQGEESCTCQDQEYRDYSWKCVDAEQVCEEWGQRCTDWRQECVAYERVCAEWECGCCGYVLECAFWGAYTCCGWDAEGNCIHWCPVCTEWVLRCSDPCMICISWEYVCTEWRDVCYDWEPYCVSYTYVCTRYECVPRVTDTQTLYSDCSLVPGQCGFSPPPLSVELTAIPSSGTAPLNDVDLKAEVSGTATGDITYKFDCTNNGTWEKTITQSGTTYIATDLCDYSSAENYTAKVEVTRQDLTAEDTATITVMTVIPLHILSVSKTGSGTVTGPGIDCGTDCSELYASGTSVTLTATPASGWLFSSWSGACSGTGNCTLTMNSNKSVTAAFAPPLSVELTAIPSSGTAPLNDVDLKAEVSGTATGTINYTFYCNRSDSGTNITSDYDFKIDGTSINPYTAQDVCDYPSAGNYTAKVIVERGPLVVEDRTTISVNEAPNQPPDAVISCEIINCGGSGCQCNGAWATFNGDSVIYKINNNSTDPDGQIVSSTWSIIGYQDPWLTCSPANPLCGITMPRIQAENYTIKLVVKDNDGLTDTATHPITVKQDAVAGFMCSLDNENWQVCESLSVGREELVYFRDNLPPPYEHSLPSTGASIISRVWEMNGVQFAPNGEFGSNESNTWATLTEAVTDISLRITDNQGRTDSKSHQINVGFPLPEWEEIPPFIWLRNLLASVLDFF